MSRVLDKQTAQAIREPHNTTHGNPPAPHVGEKYRATIAQEAF